MKKLSEYKVLSFDCYGTLIDWETGLLGVLNPWGKDVGLDLDDEQLLMAYADNEAAVMREFPSRSYPELLGMALKRTARDLGRSVSEEWIESISGSVPRWPAFSDSAAALQSLGRRYDLVILSNVHRKGFEGSNKHLKGEYAAVITAEDVGAYKPALHHFSALQAWREERGIADEDQLHVAQSLFHDHVPARKLGLDSVWINRRHDRPGWGATPQASEEWHYDAEYKSMEEFADAVERDFEGQ